eukprot:8769784-Pyramimonas_sp.AAC.1
MPDLSLASRPEVWAMLGLRGARAGSGGASGIDSGGEASSPKGVQAHPAFSPLRTALQGALWHGSSLVARAYHVHFVRYSS